ncbi:NACHT domain-containing protein [Streptomyces sp. NPDC005706]|uniref:NACHT domain-containing protein n=1 Tax=Streptomyces sp. NPDC005706 TaxID=3157169 RepID=UPI0033FBA5BD
MVGWEQLVYKVATSALRSAASAATRSAVAPKMGALIVDQGSTGRLKNKFIPTVAITDKDIKEFSKHVMRVIEPILEQEFRNLDRSEIGAILEAVGQSFAVTSADVFASDFDPQVYSRAVLAESQKAIAEIGLSEAGDGLYVRVVTEVSAQMLNFVTTWPSFLARSNVEQLKRLTGLAKDLRNIRRAVIEDASAEEVRFEETYSEVVVAKLDQLELFGVTLSQPEQRAYPLSAAYISLSVAESFSHSSPERSEIDRELIEINVDEVSDWPTTVSDIGGEAGGGIRSESAIASYDRILLRGDAGSGKTTLLHWLAVNAARRSLDGELRQFNGLIPFLLPLRRFADRELPAAHDFLNEIGKHIVGEMPTGWVNRVLRSGHAFILIDGVDELPEHRRHEAKEWLEELLDAYPNSRYIVTSRPAAAEEKWLTQERFTSVDMLPMSRLDIENFVNHWHEAARACLSSDVSEEDLEDLANYEKELVKAIRSQRQLRKLASNPLLCALLCTLSRDRRMQLPQGRMELYSAALEMLLVRRDVERRIKAGDAPSLTLNQKQRILGSFAYWLLRNQLSDTTEEQAIDQVRLALESMPAVSAGGPKVYKYLMVRSGLLRRPVEGRVDFIHRTFQEYLAAATIVSMNDIGSLVKNAHLDQWHEVVAMAVGHARPEECSEILNGLIARGNEEPNNTTRLHLLAAACLENADQLDRETFNLVRHHAEKLIPPSKVSEAKELAAVGESVLPLLPRSGRRLLAQKAASTVRTASLVGGEAALDILSGFGSDSRKSVYAELSRAWTQFDVDEYAKRVMSKSPVARRELVIDHDQLLPTLRHFSDLQHLQCHCPVQDFEWLDHCHSLRSLALWNGSAVALDAIAKLPNLKALAIGYVDPDEQYLRGFANLSGLESLTLNTGSKLDLDFAAIPQMGNLRRLQAGGARSVKNFGDVRQFPKLQILLFRFCGNVDFSKLRGADGLNLIQLLHVGSLSNAHTVSGMRDLRINAFSVADSCLPELAKIEAVKSLRIRVRRGAENREVDLSSFAGRGDIDIRFSEPVRLVTPAASLGPGVRVVIP